MNYQNHQTIYQKLYEPFTYTEIDGVKLVKKNGSAEKGFLEKPRENYTKEYYEEEPKFKCGNFGCDNKLKCLKYIIGVD